ncbi:hypothetical protein ACN20G_26400 (plasmid) [Streptomyces sp. BI20]|uniref:hypothetical protein n=1 Tax=Streptomyces sp. BI20 TaxID=3403460 RepID=UPI003C711031
MRPADVWELTARIAHGVTVAAAGLDRARVVERSVEAGEAALAARPAPGRGGRVREREALITRVRWEKWQRIDALLVEAGEVAVYEPATDAVAVGYAAEAANADTRRHAPDLAPPYRTGPLRGDVMVPEPTASPVRTATEHTGRRDDKLLQEPAARIDTGTDSRLALDGEDP